MGPAFPNRSNTFLESLSEAGVEVEDVGVDDGEQVDDLDTEEDIHAKEAANSKASHPLPMTATLAP